MCIIFVFVFLNRKPELFYDIKEYVLYLLIYI